MSIVGLDRVMSIVGLDRVMYIVGRDRAARKIALPAPVATR